ncbi:hypothetical protein VTL71DRAFT_5873 [Oculimacula yallundae]|uniref:Uncharacterized protein n=1 Tax=Oculimacula yallundae TaxID=86028 RepID=A0ABR4BYR9_9HELO
MSSSPPTSVPTITSIGASPTPPEKPMQSPSEYFSMISHSPGPGQSSGNNITSPVALSRSSTSLLTPPISETHSKHERAGYFSSMHGGLPPKNDRKPSPDHRSTPTPSPGPSSGGSFYSSDTGRSPCSYSSGEYLSPPQFQGDDDKPPYISRRRSSNSLSMMKKKLRRADTIPNDRGIKVKRRYRRHGCRHHKIQKGSCQDSSNWEEPSCQIAPTATKGNKLLCRGHTGHKVPKNTRFGNTDTFGRLISSSMPGPAPPLITRRWSSVEMGAHQISLKSILPAFPLHGFSKDQRSTDENLGDQTVSNNLHDRHRSSTFTRGAVDNDIVQVVRERLTFRKIATTTAENRIIPPLSITVRRASGESGISGVAREPIDQDPRSDGGSGTETPHANAHNQMQGGMPSDAYLITNKDIEAITILIAGNLRQNLQSNMFMHASSMAQARHETRNFNAFSTGYSETPSTINRTSDTELRLSAVTQGPIQSDYLQVGGLKQPRRKSGSGASVHEVIWNNSRNSTRSFESSASEHEDDKHYDTSSEPGSSTENLSGNNTRKEAVDKGDAFDPNNARESINEWSWKLPQNDSMMPVASSDSESTDVTPRTQPDRAKNDHY